MSKRRKLVFACLLAALCLSAAMIFALPGLRVASEARADSDCVHSYVCTGSVGATCMSDAYDVYECALCGDVERDYVAGTALGHNWDDEKEGLVVTVEPGCTTMGVTLHICTRCWNSYQSDTVSATGHTWSGGAGTVHTATCTKTGYTEYVCEVCGFSYKTDETPLKDHSWTLVDKKEKSCEEDGYVLYRCEMCGGYDGERYPSTGHVYAEETTAPGCVSYGYTTHTCSVCGDRYVTDYVSPAGHEYELVEIVATETSYGYTRLTCSKCGYVYITNIVTSGDAGYTHDYVLRIHEATCFSDGYWEYVCADCGASFTCNPTAALVHDWEYGYVEPTCTEDGGWGYLCGNCGTFYCEETVEALGHDYEESVTAPSCTEGGYSTFRCRECGDTYYGAYTAATGHAYEVRDAVVSTSQKTLSLSYVCPGCGSSAVSRLEVVFTDAAGGAYTYYFDTEGVADFSSLPDGNYTASVVDTYLDATVSMFTVGSSSSGAGGSSGAEEDTRDSGTSSGTRDDTEHEHEFKASLVVSESEKAVTVSYKCACGEDLTDETYVSFRGADGAWTFYPVGGKADYSSVPAGEYTLCLFYEDTELGRLALTISDGTERDAGADADPDTGADDDAAGEEAEDGEGAFSDDSKAEDEGTSDEGAGAGAGESRAEEVSDEDGDNAALFITLLAVFVAVVGVLVALAVSRRRKKKKKAEPLCEPEDDEE